jgi:hypothetical protein
MYLRGAGVYGMDDVERKNPKSKDGFLQALVPRSRSMHLEYTFSLAIPQAATVKQTIERKE